MKPTRKVCTLLETCVNRSIRSNRHNIHCFPEGTLTFTKFLPLNTYTIRGYSTTSNSSEAREKVEWRQKVVGAQPTYNLKVGPYKRGKWFVSYKDDPGSFITNILIILVTGYAIFTLLPGESMKVRRQRKLRQMLLDKANLTESELNYIENYKLEGENEKIK